MKCYRKNGSDLLLDHEPCGIQSPSMKCYRKNGSDRSTVRLPDPLPPQPSMKCYRKNGSDREPPRSHYRVSDPQ